jgi:hypothetical protein
MRAQHGVGRGAEPDRQVQIGAVPVFRWDRVIPVSSGGVRPAPAISDQPSLPLKVPFGRPLPRSGLGAAGSAVHALRAGKARIHAAANNSYALA